MASRALLRSQIAEAWSLCINEDYAAQRINSERSLQAAVWSRLKGILPETRRMFIEPRMIVTGKVRQVRYPDIVICNTRQVIGIIELKYRPRTRAAWRKDIDKFRSIADSKTGITVSNERYRGVEANSHTYTLAITILYVWAGVHAESGLDLAGYVGKLAPNFIALHAETVDGEPPRLVV